MRPFATLLFLGGLLFNRVCAEPWVGTQYVAFVETTAVDGYTLDDYTRDPVIRTRTVKISPTGANPEVLSTYTDTAYQVTAVNLVVEPTAGATLTTIPKYWSYYVNVVYTAPSSCSYTTSQTLSTALAIFVPLSADNFVTPTAVTTTTKTYQYITDRITNTMAMLDPSDLPTSVYSSLYSYYQPARYTSCVRSGYGSTGSGSGTYRNGGSSYSSCEEFIWYIGGSAFSGGYCCSDGCHYTWGISPVGLGLAIFFGWFGLFLIIGLIESWFVFRRTMQGHKARTGLPYGFALLCPILSCLTLFTVKKYGSKTPDQQAFLAARWKEMSAGSKLGLWLKSFFRRRDPAAVALGLTGHVPLPIPTQNPPQGQWYPPPGAPGSPVAPGMPPMAAYPPQGALYPPQGAPYPPEGYIPQVPYPAPVAVPREGEVEGQPKAVNVSETERS